MDCDVLRLFRECSRIVVGRELCDVETANSYPDASKALYARVGAIATRTAKTLYFVSLGNLMANEDKVGVTCSYPEELSTLTEQGFICEQQPTRRSPSIHCLEHAFKSRGATWGLFVPVWAPQASRSVDALIGGITIAWSEEPSDPSTYIRIVQGVAEEMAGALLTVMQPVIDDVLDSFLPHLKDMDGKAGPGSLPAAACRLNGPTDPGGAPGSPGVLAGSPQTALLLQEAGLTTAEPGKANPSRPVLQDLGVLPTSPTVHTEGGSTSMSGAPNILGSAAPCTSKAGSVPCKVLGSPAGSEPGKAVHAALGNGLVDDVVAEKARVRQRGSPQEPATLRLARQDPLFLTFDDPKLEAGFVEARGQALLLVEFVFAAFSVLVIWLLNPQPEMGPTIYKYLGCAACLVHALVVYALPTWYVGHRELYCTLTAILVHFTVLQVWMTYLASVPSYMARRSYLTELAVVPTVIVANQIRFRTAILYRTPIMVAFSLIIMNATGPAGWGLSHVASVAFGAVGQLLIAVPLLHTIRSWEIDDRRAFLAQEGFQLVERSPVGMSVA